MTLNWIKARVGHQLNEESDAHAKQGAMAMVTPPRSPKQRVREPLRHSFTNNGKSIGITHQCVDKPNTGRNTQVLCRFCGDEHEEFIHLICECPALARERLDEWILSCHSSVTYETSSGSFTRVALIGPWDGGQTKCLLSLAHRLTPPRGKGKNSEQLLPSRCHECS